MFFLIIILNENKSETYHTYWSFST